jgi:AcrR family transcriptional regulator
MSADTRDRLVSAAERLFATRGIEAVSLREITRASGAKNAVAAQYHFADRAGVVAAVLDKHRPDVEARRNGLLDQYEADGEPHDLRFLAGALVRPLAAKLATPDGGAEFLQIYADLLNRPQPHLDLDEPSLERWHRLAGRQLDDDAATMHRRFTALLYTAVELARRARAGGQDDHRLFTSWLVDIVAAVLGAPVSEETQRLRRSRDD